MPCYFLSGEPLAETLAMTGKAADDDTRRLALHMAVLEANLNGQPAAQPLKVSLRYMFFRAGLEDSSHI